MNSWYIQIYWSQFSYFINDSVSVECLLIAYLPKNKSNCFSKIQSCGLVFFFFFCIILHLLLPGISAPLPFHFTPIIMLIALQILGSYSDGLCLYFLDMLRVAEGVWESCFNEVAISFLRRTPSRSIHCKMNYFPYWFIPLSNLFLSILSLFPSISISIYIYICLKWNISKMGSSS